MSSATEVGTQDTGEPVQAFVEVALEVGLDHDSGEVKSAGNCLIDAVSPALPGYFCSPERYAGGVAAADFDSDGDPDVYITRPYGPDLLYANAGDGTFADVAASVGLGEDLSGSGAAWGDIDNDGDPDLYVTSLGDYRHYLYINDGGSFVEEGEARGAAIATEFQHSGSSVAFADYDLDGDLDIYVGEWRTLAVGDHPSHARLLENLGPTALGQFQDVTGPAGLDIDGVYLEVDGNIDGTFVLSAGWADMDSDGYPDLLLANDFGTSRLFWNNGDGTFADGTDSAQVGTDDNGMGSTVGDYDGDGDLDWYVTSVGGGSGSGNRLYRYQGDRVFEDTTDEVGVREGHWGWGASMFDLDNDADLDLVSTNGWYATAYLDDPIVAWTNDGVVPWSEQAETLGLVDEGQGRGLISFDGDGDGDLDVLVVNNAGVPRYFRNGATTSNPNGSHWLRVRTPGTTSNREGLGARVWVQTGGLSQLREMGGDSHCQGHPPREVHFGLGDALTVDVEVLWPASGEQVILEGVAVDQVLTIEEP